MSINNTFECKYKHSNVVGNIQMSKTKNDLVDSAITNYLKIISKLVIVIVIIKYTLTIDYLQWPFGH